uniref:MHC class II beta chain N-terminal domain-containing protein n=1 Tax=Otolemur garnettii TaxID=30611 RepID=H0XUU6_OTOGA
MEKVQLVAKCTYNLEEFTLFHSHVGEYQLVTKLGAKAKYWNSQKDILEQKQPGWTW